MTGTSPLPSTRPAPTARPAAERLMDAAFELFDERGYEQTTVEEIAERAQVSRTTFFRHYRSKEEVIFPRHEVLLESIRQRLATSTERTALIAVSDAVRLVLLSYLEEGDRARNRYALTSRVGALRDREIASGARYQRLFREFISSWVGPASLTALQAELMAAAVVAAHNHVLRRWLRGESDDPVTEVDDALADVVRLFTAPEERVGEPGQGTTVVVLQSDRPLDEVLPALRRAVAGE
ncbi:TetR/AcrR family transcriptional regulator [Nakamurella leprariae]|uniref:TetR/AcrR family transcriptional regulator n=1 Tax=Nakamurella leprariae TaxID=2803911 RepID=A0A938YFR9_9ACTN|nr:TetR/AcrR family transcriptional regulator [Nakamurella leprariae]MBM9469069.1 TetR/AcrR family transcriptional regulator [Nakamurella leprariae]